ncbi:ABC transporter permease [Nocardia arizonensis]|uniref:ABC transporter permease n=1 Tax=Nocardia arizonensis TaxID=1141647 RepID=UPI0009E6A591|nr:ABC transporter permease [Nocardia arizonensis]
MAPVPLNPETSATASSPRPAVHPVFGVWLVVEGYWASYRRSWRSSAAAGLLQPVLLLLAFGLGYGSHVRPGESTWWLPYSVYLAPALLAAAAVQTAAVESTFPVLAAFKWERTYQRIVTTPITPDQVLAGQLVWIAARILLSGAVFLTVACLLGMIRDTWVLVSLLLSVLCGIAFAAPLVAYAASLTSEGQEFNAVFRFVVTPMMLFSGTFFPLALLPSSVRWIAWVTPLWHGTELARGAALGVLPVWPALGHTAYLVAMAVAGVLVARRRFARRLAES